MADGNMGGSVNTLAKASSGGISFFKSDVIKPLAVGVGAGGLGVIAGRFFTARMFTQPGTTAGTTVDAPNAKRNRGLVKIAAGLIVASAIRKYSPVAALGVALGMGVDGVADLAEDTVNPYLTRWFRNPTGAGVYGRGGAVHGSVVQ